MFEFGWKKVIENKNKNQVFYLLRNWVIYTLYHFERERGGKSGHLLTGAKKNADYTDVTADCRN